MNETNPRVPTYGMIGRRALLRSSGIGGLGLAASALIGCGSKSGSTPPGPAAAGSTAPVSPSGKPVKTGGRLTSTTGAGFTFDFHREVTASANRPLMPAFNGLVQFDPYQAQQTPKTIKPDLAESWEISPDGQTYIFHLVKNAKFHDGTPFTAADAKASYERQQKPPQGITMPRGTQLETMMFDTPDPYTLRVKLSRPSPPTTMLPILAQSYLCMYAEKDIKGNFDFVTKINGTGPFRLKNADLTTKVSLDKNKDYHVKDRPYLDGFDLFNIPDASTLLAQIQSGSIHIASVTPSQLATLKQALGDKAEYQTTLLQTVSALNFNSQKGPFKDERVRQAVALAYNKTDGIKALEEGAGEIGGYMLPGGAWALPKTELEQVFGYQPYSEAGLADAKKLFAASGVAAGTNVSILTRQGSENRSLFLADQMAKIGLKGTLNVVNVAKEYDAATAGAFDGYIIALAFFVDDPDSVYPGHFLSNSPLNYSKISSKAVDDLYLKQSTELDPQKRADLVKQLEKLALPMLSKFIFTYQYNRTVIQKAKDFYWANHNQTNFRMENVWLDS